MPRSRRMRAAVAGLAAAGLVAAIAAAGAETVVPVRIDAGISPRPAPLLVGAAVHFGIGGDYGYSPEPTAAALADLGFDSFRDDVAWSRYEPAAGGSPGRLPPKVDGFVHATGARPLLILDFPNPAVDGGKAPISPAGIAAFAAFGRDVAVSTRGRRPLIEVWNEWNLTAEPGRPHLIGPGEPGDRRAATSYARLAAATTAAIRGAVPDATVLVGAAGEDPGWRWVKAVVAAGGLRRADGLSVHYYNHCLSPAKRTAADAVAAIEALHRALAGGPAAGVPIHVTEVGWPTTKGGSCDIAPDQAADNIAQFLLWAAATRWIGGVWIYQLKDQGRRPNELEDNLGLLDYDYRPKPGTCAVRDAIAIIHATEGWGIERPKPNVVLARTGGRRGGRLIGWTERPGSSAMLTLPKGRTTGYRRLCETASRSGGAIALGTRPTVIDVTGMTGAVVTVR